MLDLYKLLDKINMNDNTLSVDVLDEVYYPIIDKKSDMEILQNSDLSKNSTRVSIYVRCKSNEVSRNNTVVSHATSIKYEYKQSGNKIEIEIAVPTKAYSTLKPDSKQFQSIITFQNSNKIDKSHKKIVMSFIYECQMAIVAYWYCSSSTSIEALALMEYMRDAMIDIAKGINKISQPKSVEELDYDKKEIMEYVRRKTSKPDITLNFGR